MQNRFAFIGGETGKWLVTLVRPVRGEGLDLVARVDVVPAGDPALAPPANWRIEGQISNLRYATRAELTVLRSRQELLGRVHALHAAMIPLKKSAAWWDLAQDERRALFEDTSQHTAIGMRYFKQWRANFITAAT